MAANDYAILVGISRYADPLYPRLDGPPHDVDLFKTWLTANNGGDVPPNNIKMILSPPSFPDGQDPMLAPPMAMQFDKEYLDIERQRMAMQGARVANRLYLYFSGHGFSSRDIARGAEAALYAANASKDYYPHIYGTYFANRAQSKALFKEIVLIMDCCRDAEANRVPTAPTLPNTPDDERGANAWMLQIYAVPRGGKAQERAIPERGNNVHGLLTHALIKAFEQARPGDGGLISATHLRDHVKQSWDTVFGTDAPPSPHFYLPTTEMYFSAQNVGVSVSFTFAAAQPNGATLILKDGALRRIGALSATGIDADDIVAADSPILQTQRSGTTIQLRMLPGFYSYELSSGAAPAKGNFKVETGNVNVSV